MIPTVIPDYEDVLKTPQISQINIEMIIKSGKFNIQLFNHLQMSSL